jgi:hypothetical protein
VIGLVLVSAVVTTPDSEPVLELYDISAYVPGTGEVESWQPTGAPRTFVGEDLYSLINGGAVIFNEYGFRQVITQDYTSKDGKSITLEIYQMNNPASAYGIFTIKRGDEGKGIDVGVEGMLADYYLHFWKGDFLVSLTGSESEETILNGLLDIARAVDENIRKRGERPPLCDLLLIEGYRVSNIKYLMGNLALSNNLQFASDEVFKLKEGVIGDYGDFKLYVFKYGNRNESLSRYQDAHDLFRNSTVFGNFTDHKDECAMVDGQDRAIHMRLYENYILIFVGNSETEPGSILEKLQHNITERSDI